MDRRAQAFINLGFEPNVMRPSTSRATDTSKASDRKMEGFKKPSNFRLLSDDNLDTKVPTQEITKKRRKKKKEK